MAYFPNGSSAMILELQCGECLLSLDCPVYRVQINYNYEQCKNETLEELLNMLITEDGICEVKKAINCAQPPTEDISELEAWERHRGEL